MSVFHDHWNRRVKTKQHQIYCTVCQSRIHNLSTTLKKCLTSQNTQIKVSIYICTIDQIFFLFQIKQVHTFSCQILALMILIFLMTQIFFLSENLKTFFTESNSTETPLKDADQQVSVDSKCHNINSFNKVTIKRKNSTLATFHLNITSLSKHVDDLHNLALLNHSFDIIGISKHKISNNSNNINFNLPGYTLCYNECASPYRGTGFFLSLTI